MNMTQFIVRMDRRRTYPASALPPSSCPRRRSARPRNSQKAQKATPQYSGDRTVTRKIWGWWIRETWGCTGSSSAPGGAEESRAQYRGDNTVNRKICRVMGGSVGHAAQNVFKLMNVAGKGKA